MTKKSPETILREALVVALEVLESYGTTHVGAHHAAIEKAQTALRLVPAIPPIPHASDIERKIAGKVVQCLLDEGFKITVLAEGDDEVIKRCEHAPMIFEAMASSSYDVLQVTSNPKSHRRNSFVQLVWGNGVDVISDYGMSLEEVLAPANELAEALDDRS